MNPQVNPYKAIKKKKIYGIEYLILDHQKSSSPTQLTKEQAELITMNSEGIKFYVKEFDKLKIESAPTYIEPNVTIFKEHDLPVILVTDNKNKLRYVGKSKVQLIVDCLPEIKSFAAIKEVAIQEEIKWWDK